MTEIRRHEYVISFVVQVCCTDGNSVVICDEDGRNSCSAESDENFHLISGERLNIPSNAVMVGIREYVMLRLAFDSML